MKTDGNRVKPQELSEEVVLACRDAEKSLDGLDFLIDVSRGDEGSELCHQKPDGVSVEETASLRA